MQEPVNWANTLAGRTKGHCPFTTINERKRRENDQSINGSRTMPTLNIQCHLTKCGALTVLRDTKRNEIVCLKVRSGSDDACSRVNNTRKTHMYMEHQYNRFRQLRNYCGRQVYAVLPFCPQFRGCRSFSSACGDLVKRVRNLIPNKANSHKVQFELEHQDRYKIEMTII